jgi:hypothetical protein
VIPTSGWERLWRALRAGVKKGVQVAGPAGLAAGAMTVVFPPAGAAAAAVGLGSVGTAAAQEALKSAVQFGATGVLDRILAGEPARASARQRFEAVLQRMRWAVVEAASAALSVADNEAPSDVLVPLKIEITSCYYAAYHAALDVDVPSKTFDRTMTKIAELALRLGKCASARWSPAIEEELTLTATLLEKQLEKLKQIADLVKERR